MNSIVKKISKLTCLWLVFLLGISINSHGQSKGLSTIDSLDIKLLNWYNLSPTFNKVEGTDVDRVYREITPKLKPKKKVIVAIIDSGTDTEHPDLQGRFWINEKEIPNNGIDDDNNGYIDDIHGWGFLGNAKGENITFENVEQTRIYREYDEKFKNVKSPDTLTPALKKEYNMYLKSKARYLEEFDKHSKTKSNTSSFEKGLRLAEETVLSFLGKKSYTVDDLKSIFSMDERVTSAKKYLLNLYNNGFTQKYLDDFKANTDMYLEKHYNLNFKPRDIIGDNPYNINEKNYGNNDVKGPRSDHGTPVAGVIAAVRDNGIGVNGIAENVSLMILRAVPRGDERDKDIALAIRYAVDNGANIINMSFGKDFSPQKEFIDDAIKYAQEHNVLMIHAAGNDGENIDIEDNYPTNLLNDGSRIDSWITVGANDRTLNKKLTAIFSNYGQKSVDLFAPGVDMIVLYPGNKYSKMDGTSFAGPVVTGIAALVWSYYPELTSIELKDILLKSANTHQKQKVFCPNLKEKKTSKVKFSTLSKTGGIVNAYNAMKLADEVVRLKGTSH